MSHFIFGSCKMVSKEIVELRRKNMTSVIQQVSPEEVVERILAAVADSEENLDAAETLLSSLFAPRIPAHMKLNRKTIRQSIQNGITLSSSRDNQTESIMIVPKRLEEVLENPILVAAFSEFLAECFSDENIKFWARVEKYRARHKTSVSLLPFVVDTFNLFICEQGDYTVNISNEQRVIIARTIKEAVAAQKLGATRDELRKLVSIDLLAIAQEEVGELLASSLPKFRTSNLYERAMEEQEKIRMVEQLEILNLPDLTSGDLAPQEWACILSGAVLVSYQWSEEILTQLKFCHHLYILVEGELTFTFALQGESEPRTTIIDKRGTLFGEFSMLGITSRSIFTVSVTSKTARIFRVDIPFLYTYFKCSPYVGLRFFNTVIQNALILKETKTLQFITTKLSTEGTKPYFPHPELSDQLLFASFAGMLLARKKVAIQVFITKEAIFCFAGNSLVDSLLIESTLEVEQSSKENLLFIQNGSKKMRLECPNRDNIATMLSLLSCKREEPEFIEMGLYTPSFTHDMWHALQYPPIEEECFTYFRKYCQRDIIVPNGETSKSLVAVLSGSCVATGHNGSAPLDLAQDAIFEGDFFSTSTSSSSLRCSENNTKVLFINSDYIRKLYAKRCPDLALSLYYHFSKQICYRTTCLFTK